MNKAEYAKKLDAIKIIDTMTVAEAKNAKANKNRLNKFWEKAALKYVLITTGDNIALAVRGQSTPNKFFGCDVKFNFDLKVTGLVKIELWDILSGHGDFGAFTAPKSLVAEYRVPKAKLFN